MTTFIPGRLFAILGARLADQPMTADSDPLPGNLGGVTVTVGGILLPLRSVSPDEIVALLPADINANAAYQLVVTRGDRVAAPETIIVRSPQ